MKKIVFFIVVISFTAIMAFGYFISNFTLFEESEILVEKISNPTKGYSIKIYKILPNATVQGGIQIRKSVNENEEILKNYEIYDELKEFKVENNILFLKISDSKNRLKILKDSINFY